jgi:hypothetical protein
LENLVEFSHCSLERSKGIGIPYFDVTGVASPVLGEEIEIEIVFGTRYGIVHVVGRNEE